MKKSFRLLALAMAMLMSLLTFSLVSCSDDKDTSTDAATDAVTDAGTSADGEETNEDLAYVMNKGKLIVGITDFAPMDYQEEGSDEWVGFDADMAKAFAADLGVEVEFVIIEWTKKIPELDAKTIDCVWNGMTLDDAIKNAMETSNPYCTNMQVVVVRSDKKDEYSSLEAIKDLNFAAEGGSAGEKLLTSLGYNVTPTDNQAAALMEVSSGTSDASVIDLLMARAMIGEGTSYENLTYTVALNEANKEEYGVGFRKGSALAEKLNDFMKRYYESGKMKELAEKYEIQDSLIEQK